MAVDTLGQGPEGSPGRGLGLDQGCRRPKPDHGALKEKNDKTSPAHFREGKEPVPWLGGGFTGGLQRAESSFR